MQGDVVTVMRTSEENIFLFAMTIGLHQGLMLSPYLFALFIYELICHMLMSVFLTVMIKLEKGLLEKKHVEKL